MKWAINHRNQHVRADAPGVYSWFELHCPVCKQRVFSRRGAIREAHFAHYGGNSSKACELYQPGEGGSVAPSSGTNKATATRTKRAFGNPAILWRSERAFPASLYLRLPSAPGGYSSNVRVISRGTAQFRGADLHKVSFACLRLQMPPGECETTPRDPDLEAAVNEALSQFQFAGNYFRATNEGGILLSPDDPLEIGEEYWLITQTALAEPVSEYVRVLERRSDRAWFAYRIAIPLFEGSAIDAIGDLASYLQRRIIRTTPKVSLIWPAPCQVDPDGVPVFDVSFPEILVRSPVGTPQCLLDTTQLISPELVSQGLFSFRFDGAAGEALIGLPEGNGRRIRFASCDLSSPNGVTLHSESESVQLFDKRAGALLSNSSGIRIEVPSHRLWRNVRVNGVGLKPLPDGSEHAAKGQLFAINAGAFGAATRFDDSEGSSFAAPWHASAERIVAKIIGSVASDQLKRVQNRSQLIRWASEHNADVLLPKLLSILHVEVTSGVP